MWRTREIGTHTLPISMGAFFPLDSHPMVYFIICEIHGRLGNWYPFFPQSVGTFLPLNSHLMVYFTTWEMYGFSHQFLIAQENAAKSTSYPKILTKSAATMVFGRKVSQGSNFKKDSQCWGRNYDVRITNLFHNFIFLTQKCP